MSGTSASSREIRREAAGKTFRWRAVRGFGLENPWDWVDESWWPAPCLWRAAIRKPQAIPIRFLHVMVLDLSLARSRARSNNRSGTSRSAKEQFPETPCACPSLRRPMHRANLEGVSVHRSVSLPLGLGSGNHYKSPGLLIGTGRGREATRSATSISSRRTARKKSPHRASCPHPRLEFVRPCKLLFSRHTHEWNKWDCCS